MRDFKLSLRHEGCDLIVREAGKKVGTVCMQGFTGGWKSPSRPPSTTPESFGRPWSPVCGGDRAVPPGNRADADASEKSHHGSQANHIGRI